MLLVGAFAPLEHEAYIGLDDSGAPVHSIQRESEADWK